MSVLQILALDLSNVSLENYSDEIKQLLSEHLKERMKQQPNTPDSPLFIGKKHCRLNRSQVYRFINEVCKRLEIKANVGTRTMKKTHIFMLQ